MKTVSKYVIAFIFAFVLLIFISCPWPNPEPPYAPPPIGIVVLWKGESESPPTGAQSNWAYYNTTTGNAYIYDGEYDVRTWLVLPQKEISLIWKGNAPVHPNSPELNWAYYNSTDNKTYIFGRNEWKELLSGKAIAPHGILLEDMMVRIPAGSFQMGSPADEPDRWAKDETQHQVMISNDFYMGRYPLTQAEWHLVLGTGRDPRGLNNSPITYVNWYDAIEFCNRLSIMEGLNPAYSLDGETDPDKWETRGWQWGSPSWDNIEMLNGANGYRLPTEAEWEYACRAGTNTAFNWGTNKITTEQANFDGSKNLYNGSPVGLFRNGVRAVGTFAPNKWGLYDMHGNVEEWCWDWYDADYYESGPDQDPHGPASGSERVVRGGRWSDPGKWLRSAYRYMWGPGYFGSGMGFRLVCSEGQ